MSQMEAPSYVQLDMAYVAMVAESVAGWLAKGDAVEVNYQPGDMTAYHLVFTPIGDIAVAPSKDPSSRWEARCEFGVPRVLGAAVVAWVGHGAAALDLATGGYHGGYVEGLYGNPGTASGWALAILFNAISDQLS